MKRRAVLASGGAALAAAAGGAGAWWYRHGHPSEEAALDVQALWQQRFKRPDGGELRMAELRGRPLVLNFWAPWCAPCVQEMPRLDEFARQFAAGGWQVVGLAADTHVAVQQFLQRTPVSFPVGIAGAEALAWSRALGNLYGALPFTVVIDRQGHVVQRRLGEIELNELVGWTRLPALR